MISVFLITKDGKLRLKENAMILYMNYLREETLKCLLTTEIFTLHVAFIFKPSTKNKKKLILIFARLTPGIRLHRTGVGTKNAGVDKKSTNRVGICKRSFLRHNNILQ
jgi:hypothetical protein